MPDWKLLVRSHIPPTGLPPGREAEVVDELAQLLEDAAIAAGIDFDKPNELEAWVRRELAKIGDLEFGARSRRRAAGTSAPVNATRALPRRSSARPLNGLTLDARYAVRKLIAHRTFTFVAVITLALGIGLNTAVFSVVNAVLFKPLPVHEPDRLVSLYSSEPNQATSHVPMSFADFNDLRQASRSLGDVVGYALTMFALELDTRGELVLGELVTGDYFTVLGVQPALGRAFTADEDLSGDERAVAVLSHAAWQRRFGADPGIIGSEVLLGGTRHTVVGVAPPEFLGLTRGLAPEVWVPLRGGIHRGAVPIFRIDDPTPGMDRFSDRRLRWLWVVGRLGAGASMEQLSSELRALTARLQRDHPEINRDRSLIAVPTSSIRLLPSVDRALYGASFVLMMVVSLVLLIACANIANMLLAHASARRMEIATRLSLGAGRRVIIRQLLVESLTLAVTGSGLGLLVAWIATRSMASLRLPFTLDLTLDLSLDLRVFAFTLIVACLTALAFGLVPSLEASRQNLASVLYSESHRAAGSYGGRRLRSLLVVAQVALSVMLLVCGGLSLRSVVEAVRVDPGFTPQGAVVCRFAPHLQGYSKDQVEDFYQQLKERVSRLTGFKKVAFADRLPLSFALSIESVAAEGRGAPDPREWPSAHTALVSPGYFEAMGVTILKGRGFNDLDTRDSDSVVVVNQHLASTLWPGEDALDQRLRIDGRDDTLRVVGVARDGKYLTLGEDPSPCLYESLTQRAKGSRVLIARISGSQSSALTSLRAAAKSIDERIAITELQTLEQAIAPSLFLPRAGAVLFSVIGLAGMLLSVVGLYGVIAYGVSQRTREIGIRMAIGADSGEILRSTLREGLLLGFVGSVIGLAGALATTRVLSSILCGVSPNDPLTFTLVPLVLLGFTAAATLIPARRAASIDPMEALRQG